MCLIIFAVAQHPDWPLVLAANRDEQHQRASAAAATWPENPAVVGGRDLVSGGSWLACHRDGRWAAVTNDPRAPLPLQPQSRGRLVSDFLLSQAAPSAWVADVFAERTRYAGFHLLAGTAADVWYTGNANDECAPRRLPAGCYGLANRGLDSECGKVAGGKRALRRLLQSGPTPAKLLTLLRDERTPAGVYASPIARLVAPRFIRSPTYGTRASTAVMFNRQGEVTLRERSFGPTGAPLAEQGFVAAAGPPASSTEEIHWHGQA